ncbi:MAG: hypothetical protein AB1521_01165 [Bacteroidota bacterium]
MKKLEILTYRNPQYAKCRGCGKSATLHHSRARNMKEQIIKKMTYYKIYRCDECGWRGYIPSITFSRNFWKSALIYLLLIFISAYLVNFLISFVM